jgi:hypothetical protein
MKPKHKIWILHATMLLFYVPHNITLKKVTYFVKILEGNRLKDTDFNSTYRSIVYVLGEKYAVKYLLDILPFRKGSMKPMD